LTVGVATVPNQIITSTVPLPTEYRPANNDDALGVCNVIDNAGTIRGSWNIGSDGFIRIWAGYTNISFFSAAGTEDGLAFNAFYYIY
jgi:hypothetical protein